MKAFLSHSSVDKDLVMEVYESLDDDATWVDRAEIEWGDYFLEKITLGIEEATEFLLFWSANSAKSNWVRLELNMVFIRMMEEKAIRLCVIKLDDTELSGYLKPYQFLDVSESENAVSTILEAVNRLDKEPGRVLRRRFLNRSTELSQMEAAIDDPETYLLVLSGFAGIGKETLGSVVIFTVIPAFAGMQGPLAANAYLPATGFRVPAFAGMTETDAWRPIFLN